MNYKVVELKEKTVVGISAKTSNEDPKMGEIIGGIWNRLFDGVIETVKNRSNQYTIGLYSDYTQEGYTVTAGCEVSKVENQALTVKTIPAGKYAKFSFEGPMDTMMVDAWQEVWSTELPRNFKGDFEEYLNKEQENCKMNIYISIE